MFELIGFGGFVYFYLALSIVNVGIANGKNRSDWKAFLGSLLFTPIIVWAYYVAVPALPTTDRDA